MDNNLVAFISSLFPIARVQPNFDKLVFDDSLDDYLIGAVVIPGPVYFVSLSDAKAACVNKVFCDDLSICYCLGHFSDRFIDMGSDSEITFSCCCCFVHVPLPVPAFMWFLFNML